VLQYLQKYDYFAVVPDTTDATDSLERNSAEDCCIETETVSYRSDRSGSKNDQSIAMEQLDCHEESKVEYSCYYCNSYYTNNDKDYERHVILKHPRRLAYPSKTELERLGISGKGMSWEI
jgi:hypothetical protein